MTKYRKPEKTPIVPATATRCPACGSTDRSGYHRTTEADYSGLTPDGQACTHIVRRWTTCAACGQQRVDRSYENRARKLSQN
jgi:hypothetical protein